jgi:hypothetical protein
MGVRWTLLASYLERDRNDEARVLLDRFPDEGWPVWLYGDALVAFRAGATDADRRLRHALAGNRHLASMLSGTRRTPEVGDTYQPGSVEEAAICADYLVDAWSATPGAVAWVKRMRQTKRPRAK